MCRSKVYMFWSCAGRRIAETRAHEILANPKLDILQTILELGCHTDTHTDKDTQTHTRAHTQTHAHTHACMHARMYVHTCVHMYTHRHSLYYYREGPT